MADLYSEKKVKTRKEHRCDLCGRKIPKGFTAVYKKGKKFMGDFFSVYHCNTCAELGKYFYEFVTDWEGYYSSEDLADSMQDFECTTPLQLLNKLKEKYKV